MNRALRLMAARIAADHQGPHDLKQAAALAEYLRDIMTGEGADGDAIVDTLISMLNNPRDFAEEFAEVQGREAPPVLEGGDAAMPMPAQEEAPPEATMPMPGMAPPPGSTTAKVAADNIAGKCPHCDSHTTGVIKEDGMSRCHNCNKTFKTPKVEADPIDSSSMNVHGKTAEVEEPELHDHQELHDHDPETPSSMRWVDENGVPLEVGKEYEMQSNRSDIPDYIRVLGPGAIDPDTNEMGGPVMGDTLKYEITGEYGLSHVGDLSLDEYENEEIVFSPTDDGDDLGDDAEGPDDMLDNNGDSDRTMFEGSPEQTDLSKPTVNLASIVGRHPRTDEFARPHTEDRPNADDPSFPLVDAPYPNKFSSVEQLEAATAEWQKEHLTPALNYRAAKSITSVIKSKIAKGEEIDQNLWQRVEALGGPHYAAEDEEPEGPFTEENRPNRKQHWTTWHEPDAENRELIGGRPDTPVGRGLVMHAEDSEPILHTWPIHIKDRLEGNPERYHMEHMNEIEWDPASSGRTAAFDITTDDSDGYRVEPNSVYPTTEEDMKLLESAHPELARRSFMSKAAGAEYNLMEQKEFIGERGVARNADKLDLENTHYAETVEDHFLFGL